MSARARLLGVLTVLMLLIGGLSVAPVTPASAAQPRSDGTYIRYGGATYKVVWGAPMVVTSWPAVGLTNEQGEAAVVVISAAEWEQYAQHPADGKYIKGHGTSSTYYVAVGGRPYPRVAPAGAAVQTADPAAISGCDHLNCSPWGVLESAVATGVGQVTVSGWAVDPEATAGPVEYSWLIDGTGNQGGNSGLANQPHAAVAVILEPAGNFGFSRTISVPSGTRTICLYLHDGGNYGRSLTMNCATVNVPAPPLPPTAFPSAPRKVKAVAKQGKAVVKWKAPASSGDGPVTEYVVLASTGQKVNTKKTKAVVRRLKPGKKVTFTVTAYNKFGAGAESKRTKKVRIRR